MTRSTRKLGEILIAKGLITREQLKDALYEQQKTKEFLGTILLRKAQLKEKDLSKALSEHFDIPFVSLKNKYINWNFVKRHSTSLVLDYKCIPLYEDDLSVTCAITNPLDVWVLKKAEEEARGRKLKLVLVTEQDLQETIQRYSRYIRGDITKITNPPTLVSGGV